MGIRYFKKHISLMLALLLAVSTAMSLTGCKKDNDSNSNKNSSKTSSKTSSSTSSKPDNNNVLSQINSSDISSTGQSEPDEPVDTEPTEQLKPVAIDVNSIDLSDLSQFENEKKGWGQGKQVDDKNRPISCDVYQKKYGEYGGVFIMPDDESKMYLTFDEGYENGYTSIILDALKEKDCQAVFFVTMPYVKQNPDLIKRMVDEGHVIGNHSVKHLSMPTLDDQTAIDEIAGLHNYMVENYNYQMTLFRPPMGEWSTRTLAIAKQLGYKTVLWSYAYLDYDVNNQMGVEKAFPKVTGAAHNGAVYLLHAVSKDNADMLADAIDKFREDGYSLDLLK